MESTKFKCPYCGKEFTRERTLQVHMCEPKRRHLQKNEKWAQCSISVLKQKDTIYPKRVEIMRRYFATLFLDILGT